MTTSECLCCGATDNECAPPMRNYYHHEACDTSWEDVWCGTPNDRCPTCNVECEPYQSEDYDG